MQYNKTVPIELIAKTCHQVNKVYCEWMGDYSQQDWEVAPDWQKQSILKGVNAYLSNPDLTPEQSHENWMEHKLNEGWVYGVEKDVEKKTHPCLVPYSELPESQQLKDHLFRAIVLSFRPHTFFG